VEENAGQRDLGEDIGFLPFPNQGERDFAEKYDSLSAKDLHYRIDQLNKIMSEAARVEAESRFDRGLYVVHDPITLTGGEMDEDFYFDKPVGLGRVWPCSTVIGLQSGNPELRVTYLTEAEFPELFAMRDEWLYAAQLWKEKSTTGD
jgi:hypothetical protein